MIKVDQLMHIKQLHTEGHSIRDIARVVQPPDHRRRKTQSRLIMPSTEIDNISAKALLEHAWSVIQPDLNPSDRSLRFCTFTTAISCEKTRINAKVCKSYVVAICSCITSI